MSYICEYCKGSFSSKCVLIFHQKKAKYCLDIQLKINPETIIINIPCQYCGKNFTRNNDKNIHESICKNNKSKNPLFSEYEKKLKEKDTEINEIKLEYEKKLKEKDTEINEIKIKFENEISKREIYKELHDKLSSQKQYSVQPTTKESSTNTSKESKTLNIFKNTQLIFQNKKIIYRSSDGYVNLTQMVKINNKRFNNWNQNKDTQAFLQSVFATTGIPVHELLIFETGLNENSVTWAHPLVLINFAQWCNVDFGVKVSSWIFQLLSYGNVEFKHEKSITEIETIWKEKCKQLELETENIISLKKSLSALEKQHHYPTFDIGGPVYYIISDSSCDKQCPSSNRFKHGVAGTGEKSTFDTRLQQHRTSMPFLRVDLVVLFKNPKLIEQFMEAKFEEQLNPNHKEFFQGEGREFKEIFVENVKLFLSTSNLNYEILSGEKTEYYNNDIELTKK
jgi:hypothetical protein